jgi:hypothetical protein
MVNGICHISTQCTHDTGIFMPKYITGCLTF